MSLARVLGAGLLGAALLIAPAPASAAPADCFDRSAPITYEEGRIGAGGVPQALVEAGGFTPYVEELAAALCRVRTAAGAERLLAQRGDLLWRTAVQRAQGTRWMGTIERYDDRPLYWSRLLGTRDLRQWRPHFPFKSTRRYRSRQQSGFNC